MFQLDDKFLEELGLAALPQEQKQEFLRHVYSQLEIRVGTELSEGLSDEQLAEFESFINRETDKVMAWISQYAPQYDSDPVYVKLRSSAPENADMDAILAEFASLKWLNLNRPDYQDVVRRVLEDLKKEISENRDAILGL